MTRTIALIAVALFAGCDNNASDKAATDKVVAPDNTKWNVRDRNAATLTPGDQGENASDLGITQHIRQAIVAKDDLTTGDKNVKVITVDGVVTLRGPVESEQAKADIASIAKDAVGVTRVENELEVTGTATASADKSEDANTTK